MPDPEEPTSALAEKLLAARPLKARLALGSTLVLAIGALIAPVPAPTALAAPQERAAPLLEEQVQLREAPAPFTGVQTLAAGLRQHVVHFPGTREAPSILNDFGERMGDSRPAGLGVFLSDSQLMTHAAALGGRSSVLAVDSEGQQFSATVVAYDDVSGLVLLATDTSARQPVTRSNKPPVAGMQAVGVGHSASADMVVPVFVASVGIDRLQTSETSNVVLPGMPLFTLTGELLAVAAGDGRAGAAIPTATTIPTLLDLARTGERRSSFGIAFQDLGGPLSPVFGDKGVLVCDIVAGGPADVAGVLVGDVLVSVDGTELREAPATVRLLSALPMGGSAEIRLRRNGRLRSLRATARPTYEVAALARGRPAESVTAPEAQALFPMAVLESSGVPPSARVRRVNGRIVTSRAQVERELRGSPQPVTLLLEHLGTQFFATIDHRR